MNVLFIALIIILIIIILCHDEFKIFSQKEKCNRIDGRCYNVVSRFDKQQNASELLAKLNLFCVAFMRHIRNKYIYQYSINNRARTAAQLLLSNYNPDGIIENNPKSDVNTSYVDDKGKIFALCLREKESGSNKFHRFTDLQFVALHEMSHMATESFGHQREFWEVFKFFMKEAEEAKLFTPTNYKATPLKYCSLLVDYNPYFDPNISDIYIER